MDLRLLGLVGVVFVVALAGAVFAANWHSGARPGMEAGLRHFNGSASGFNGTHPSDGGRAFPEPGCMNGTRPDRMEFNGTRPGRPNATSEGAFYAMGPALNATEVAAAMAQFRSAVGAGDFETAASLHAQYGFGGPLFGRLNATTFATFSHIAQLEETLRSELGMNRSEPGLNGTGIGPLHGGFAGGFALGRGVHFGRMPPVLNESGAN